MEHITSVKQDKRNCYITIRSDDLKVGDVVVLTLNKKKHYFRVIESFYKQNGFSRAENIAEEIGYYGLFRKHPEPLKDIYECDVEKVTNEEEIKKINIESTYI